MHHFNFFFAGCHSDFLEIRDGYWHRSELLVRLCGNLIPNEPIISSGSRLLLTYKTSEHSPVHTGFIAAYEGFYKTLFRNKRFMLDEMTQ